MSTEPWLDVRRLPGLALCTLILLVNWSQRVHGWIDNVTERDTLCNRVWPSRGGVWTETPPYWELPNCSTRYYSSKAIAKCMKGRTLYVIGNSVPRQAAFDMIELLGGGSVDREHQKEACPKHAGDWPSSCHSEYQGVQFKYLYIQWFDGFDYTNRSGFPFYFQRVWDANIQNYTLITGRLPDAAPGHGVHKDNVPLSPGYVNNLYWSDDNCRGQEMRSCLAKFFQGSTENDILIFTMGMAYPIPDKQELLNIKQQVLNDGKPATDMTSFLISSAVNFKGHVAALFKGQVFRVSLAAANPHGFANFQTAYWERADKILGQLWKMSDEAKPWYSIDQWAINANRFHHYNDIVHFNGVLTHAMLYQVFTELCPSGGTDRSYLNSVIVVNATYYWVGFDNALHPIELEPNSNKLPSYFASLAIIELDPDIFSSTPQPRIPLLYNKAVNSQGGRAVYLISGGEKRMFSSGDHFFKAGFKDFDEVISLPVDLLNDIPSGPDI
jgi:hypothetical protein